MEPFSIPMIVRLMPKYSYGGLHSPLRDHTYMQLRKIAYHPDA